jgi:hypothetical protein
LDLYWHGTGSVGHPTSYGDGAPHRPKHSVILGYLDDGAYLITMAMNGWADGEPTRWLNLQAHPDASVDLPTAGVR